MKKDQCDIYVNDILIRWYVKCSNISPTPIISPDPIISPNPLTCRVSQPLLYSSAPKFAALVRLLCTLHPNQGLSTDHCQFHAVRCITQETSACGQISPNSTETRDLTEFECHAFLHKSDKFEKCQKAHLTGVLF